mgnify:CR=1 FL=1
MHLDLAKGDRHQLLGRSRAYGLGTQQCVSDQHDHQNYSETPPEPARPSEARARLGMKNPEIFYMGAEK